MKTQNTKTRSFRTYRYARPVLVALVLLVVTLPLTGCHGVLLGTGAGALAGQAIGGTTEATLAGAMTGALVGAAAEGTSHHYYSTPTNHTYLTYRPYRTYRTYRTPHTHHRTCYNY